MKGALITFSLLFIFLSLFFLSSESFAAPAPAQDFCIDPATGVNNNNLQTFLDSGEGFVPCGISKYKKWSYILEALVLRTEVRGGSRRPGESDDACEARLANQYCEAWANQIGGTYVGYTHVQSPHPPSTCLLRCRAHVRESLGARIVSADTAEEARQIALQEVASGPNPDYIVPPANEFWKKEGVVCLCQIGHFFLMGYKIYKFALEIVILIAGLMLVIGGIMMMVSGGMPSVFQIGKKMIIYSMVGIVIVLASWVIVNTVFLALGYSYAWTLPGLP